MSIRATMALAFAASLLATAGCRKSTAWPPEPASIRFGEDVCAACSTIIGDPMYAAQVHDHKGAVQIFDDIGCMLTMAGTHTDPAGVFLRDATEGAWIRGDRAYVLRSSEIPSPMGYGFLAFTERYDAEAAAQAHPGAVFELKTLLGGSQPPPPRAGAGRSELIDMDFTTEQIERLRAFIWKTSVDAKKSEVAAQ